MPPQRRDSDDSGDEYQPQRRHGTRKKATPAKVAKTAKGQTPSTSRGAAANTTPGQDPAVKASPSKIRLAGSSSQRPGRNNKPVTPARNKTARSRKSADARTAATPTPSSDNNVDVSHHVQAAQRHSGAILRGLGGPTRPASTAALPSNSATSLPVYPLNGHALLNFGDGNHATSSHQFGRSLQLPLHGNGQSLRSTDTSNYSSLSPQAMIQLQREAFSRGTILTGSPTPRNHMPLGQAPSQVQDVARPIRSMPVAQRGAHTATPIMPPANLAYDVDPRGDPMDITPRSFASGKGAEPNTNRMVKKDANAPNLVRPDTTGQPRNTINNSQVNTQSLPDAAKAATQLINRGPANVSQAQAGGADQSQVGDTAEVAWEAPAGVHKSPKVEDWPESPWVALEDYITTKGVWDESDRLYMMGIQAGIGYGITTHKKNLVDELRRTGKLWGVDVSFTENQNKIPDPASLIEGIDVFEKLAAMHAATGYITIREAIQDHALELAAAHSQKQDRQPGAAGPVEGHAHAQVAAHIQRYGIQPVTGGPVGSYSVDPAVAHGIVPNAFAPNRSLPDVPGRNIPNQTADLTAMAGSRTLGGLDLSQIDGLAGALTASLQQQQQQQQLPSRVAFNAQAQAQGGRGLTINVPHNGHGHALGNNNRDTNAPEVKTPTLSETENGRAVIKMVPGEEKK